MLGKLSNLSSHTHTEKRRGKRGRRRILTVVLSKYQIAIEETELDKLSNLLVIILSNGENKVEKSSFANQNIDNYKPYIPPKLCDVDFSLHSNHNKHTAPSNSLNNHCKHLKETESSKRYKNQFN